MLLLTVSLGLGACSTPTTVEAIQGDDVAACAELASEGDRGECASLHAARLVEAGDADAAFLACEAIDGHWHDECVFRTSDALELVGEDAWQRCRGAGAYEDQCAGHAATRMVEGMTDLPLDVGDEDALIEAIQDRVSRMPIRDRMTVNRIGLARHVAARWESTPFDSTGCGVLPEEPCSLAYAETMAQDASIDRDAACAEPRTSESVTRAGGKGWTLASDPVAQRAWQDLCASWSAGAATPGADRPPHGGAPARR